MIENRQTLPSPQSTTPNGRFRSTRNRVLLPHPPCDHDAPNTPNVTATPISLDQPRRAQTTTTFDHAKRRWTTYQNTSHRGDLRSKETTRRKRKDPGKYTLPTSREILHPFPFTGNKPNKFICYSPVPRRAHIVSVIPGRGIRLEEQIDIFIDKHGSLLQTLTYYVLAQRHWPLYD